MGKDIRANINQNKKSWSCYVNVSQIEFQSKWYYQGLLFSSSVLSNSLWPRGLPGIPVLHHLLELTQTHVHRVSDIIQPSHPLPSPSSHLQSFPESGSFPMSWLFTSSGQSIGVSASASALPINIQDWFPLGWTSWISLQSTGLSRVFSNTTVQKHRFFSAQLSL